MVEQQLKPRHIVDSATLKSMATVPRHLFVPPLYLSQAYSDHPLTIGKEQTISQPYVVALMTQAAQVKNDETVLDIGTGSGYAAAVFAQIAKQVYTIERIPELAEEAKRRCQQLHYDNMTFCVGDGSLGWPQHAPYDVIAVTAASPAVPLQLLDQLKVGGRLIIPIGDRYSQELVRITKDFNGMFRQEHIQYVRFVPLIGQEGW